MVLFINKTQIVFEFKHNSKNISTYSYYEYLGKHIKTINNTKPRYRWYYGDTKRWEQFEKCKYFYFNRNNNSYLHKIVFEHNNYDAALLVIEEIIKTVTQTNNNLRFYFYDGYFFINSNNFFVLKFFKEIGNIQSKYNCYFISKIRFGKRFNAKFDSEIFANYKNVNVVKYVGTGWKNSIANLPKNLTQLCLRIRKRSFEVINMPQNFEEILINYSGTIHKIESTNDFRINKLFVVNSSTNMKKCFGVDDYKCDGIIFFENSDIIQMDNIPSCVNVMIFNVNFTKSLDYIPNSVKHLEFNNIIISDLSNLPSSIITIKYSVVDETIFKKMSELPDTVEKIIFDNIKKIELSDKKFYKLPDKLKQIVILSQTHPKFVNFKKKFITYKSEFNKNFEILIKKNNHAYTQTHKID